MNRLECWEVEGEGTSALVSSKTLGRRGLLEDEARGRGEMNAAAKPAAPSFAGTAYEKALADALALVPALRERAARGDSPRSLSSRQVSLPVLQASPRRPPSCRAFSDGRRQRR